MEVVIVAAMAAATVVATAVAKATVLVRQIIQTTLRFLYLNRISVGAPFSGNVVFSNNSNFNIDNNQRKSVKVRKNSMTL